MKEIRFRSFSKPLPPNKGKKGGERALNVAPNCLNSSHHWKMGYLKHLILFAKCCHGSSLNLTPPPPPKKMSSEMNFITQPWPWLLQVTETLTVGPRAALVFINSLPNTILHIFLLVEWWALCSFIMTMLLYYVPLCRTHFQIQWRTRRRINQPKIASCVSFWKCSILTKPWMMAGGWFCLFLGSFKSLQSKSFSEVFTLHVWEVIDEQSVHSRSLSGLEPAFKMDWGFVARGFKVFVQQPSSMSSTELCFPSVGIFVSVLTLTHQDRGSCFWTCSLILHMTFLCPPCSCSWCQRLDSERDGPLMGAVAALCQRINLHPSVLQREDVKLNIGSGSFVLVGGRSQLKGKKSISRLLFSKARPASG